MHDTDIRAQLEQERRLIDAIDLPPLEMEGFGDVDGYTRLSLYAGSPYDPDVEVVANDIRRARSAVRLQHSWNALPVRNAQVEAVLALHRKKVRTARMKYYCGHCGDEAGWPCPTVRAIEEAGK